MLVWFCLKVSKQDSWPTAREKASVNGFLLCYNHSVRLIFLFSVIVSAVRHMKPSPANRSCFVSRQQRAIQSDIQICLKINYFDLYVYCTTPDTSINTEIFILQTILTLLVPSMQSDGSLL